MIDVVCLLAGAGRLFGLDRTVRADRGRVDPVLSTEIGSCHCPSQPSLSGNCSLLWSRPDKRPRSFHHTCHTFRTQDRSTNSATSASVTIRHSSSDDVTILWCYSGLQAVGRINWRCINGKSGDCKPVRENGSAICISGLPLAFPKGASICMPEAANIRRGCNQSPMCCPSLLGTKPSRYHYHPAWRNNEAWMELLQIPAYLVAYTACYRVKRPSYGPLILSERSFQWQPN